MRHDEAGKTKVSRVPSEVLEVKESSSSPLDATVPDGAVSAEELIAAPPAFAVPTHVGAGGKFVLHERIGRGGMGTVFRATDTSLQRDVAIKLLRPSESLTSTDLLAFCVREARAIARMDHENIVRVHELDDKNDPPFIVMEYLRGQSLDEPLRLGRLPDEEVVRVMMQVARGLAHAHRLGVVHRDLKPSNVFLLRNGPAKLLDFGLARLNAPTAEALRAGDNPATRSMTMPMAGTAAYMAPEQWRGTEPDARTDMWSAFVVLFELLTGVLPYPIERLGQMASKVASNEPPPSLRQRRGDLPGDFLDWFDRCFSKDPAARCQTGDELTSRLAGLAGLLHADVPSQRGPEPQAGGAFWTDVPAPGWALHRAGRRSVLPYWQKSLLIFVGAPGDHWEGIPERTLRAARVDVDTALWTIDPHPSGARDEGGPASTSWLGRQADALRELLEGEFKRYRNLVFVGFDLGALVVKRTFVDAAAGSGAPKRRVDPRDYVYRIRQIIRVAEAASGATPASGPARRGDGTAWVDSLEAERMERELRAACRTMQHGHLPYPSCHQVSLQGPRGTDSDPDPAGAVATRLAALLTGPEIMIAREAIAQSFELDCAGKIQLLVESDANDGEEAAATVAVARTGAQAEIFRTLLEVAQQSHRQPPSLVVTGDAGVGKSTVLRHLTRHISSEYLETHRGGAQLCMFMPLAIVSLEGDPPRSVGARPRGGELFDRLLDWWCAWFGSLTYRDAVPREWVIERMRSEPLLIVMDGVDEFLTNHPAYGPADVQQMLQHVRTTHAHNSELAIVLGVRSTQPSLLSFASEPAHVYEILRLTDAQVDAFFPAARAWMAGISDAQVKRLLQTPLLLVQLDARMARPSLGEVTTRSQVLERVLLTIIERSGLPLVQRADLGPAKASQWLLALMLVAWRMFARLRGDIAIDRLTQEAREMISAWEQHLARGGHLEEAVELSSSFALLCDPQCSAALMRRTVLYSTDHGDVRFIHREWQDYLTAKYLAECLRYGYVDELGHFAFTLPMFLAAGEMLGDFRIEEDLVGEVERRTRERGEGLIHANFCAVLGNSRTPMSEPAMEMLLGDLRRAPLLSRLVTLASFGARAMRNARNDPAAGDVRRVLVRGLLALVADDSVDGLSRSLAWCNLKALRHVHGTEAPPGPWPGLGERQADENAPLDLLCDRSTTPWTVAPRHRSLQLAWVQIQSMILVAPHRPISAAHYLYTVVVCKRHRVHIPEVTQELPAVFAEGSPIALGYRNYTVVPEIWTLFQRCRDMYSE